MDIGSLVPLEHNQNMILSNKLFLDIDVSTAAKKS